MTTSADDPAAAFAVLRGLALYLLSTLAPIAALLAWPLPSSPVIGLAVAAGAAAALVLGEAAAGRAAEAQGLWRARGRLLFAVAYAALVAVALFVASAVPEPAVLAREAVVFAALQPALLLLAGAMGDPRLALANALTLVVLAALRGGTVAALAALGAFVLTAAFLAGDNAARILGAYAARRGPGLEAVLREALGLVAPAAAGLALLLWNAPPRPWGAVRGAGEPPGDLPRRAYLVLFVACMVGAGAVGLAAQFLRRRRRTPPPTEDLVEVVAIEDEALPEPASRPRASIPGRRGDVIRAYLAFLRAAAEVGRPRAAAATPAEYASSLGAIAVLPELTSLFMDARYGPEEPTAESVAVAQAAARAAIREVGRLPPREGRRGRS